MFKLFAMMKNMSAQNVESFLRLEICFTLIESLSHFDNKRICEKLNLEL